MNLDCNEQIQEAFKRVFNSKWYILGLELKEFEKQFAEYIDSGYAIGVGSGYDALKISMHALGIGNGDEVIIPSHTFIATITAVMESGAKPVLCDVDINTYNIDLQAVIKLITPHTKAIIPVHLYGNPVDMDIVINLAGKNDLWIVEDYAQSAGATWKGKKTGSFGIINGSSFYPVKNLGALGDGGIITTSDENLANFCREYRNYGSAGKYHFEYAGINSRLDEIQAAFLSVKLGLLEHWISEKSEIANRYITNLSSIHQIRVPALNKHSKPAWHIFPILCENRNALQKHLDKKGIETLIHYPVPVFEQEPLKVLGYKKGDFPVTELISKNELSLPLYPGLSFSQVDYISECIIDFFNQNYP